MTDEEKQAYWEKVQKDDEARHRLEILKSLGYMPEYQNWTFESFNVDFKNAAAFEACVKFSQKPYNLYLYGTAGNGKSRLAWAAAFKHYKDLRNQGKTPQMLFLPISEFANKAVEAKKNNSKDFIKGLLRKDVIVLDDLGAEELSKSGIDALTEFLNQWEWQKKKGLIVTCNYSIKQLAAAINNDRIPSRLSGLMEIFIENSADDQRAKDLKAKTVLAGQDFKEKLKQLGAQ